MCMFVCMYVHDIVLVPCDNITHSQIIFKTAVDHPYHSLYIILALSNACKDDEFPQSGYVTGSKSSRSHTKLHRSNSEPQSNVDEVRVCVCVYAYICFSSDIL